jgi:glycerol-3-phosphate acyltransferase PlsX
LLVGDETAIRAELAKYPGVNMERLQIIHAPENINMDESPASAVRRKKQCSINVCMDLIKRKEADAMVSAGNSGAVSAAAVFALGRIPGVIRPAIAAALPTRKRDRPTLLLDAGANMDCSEEWIAQFAVMGAAYSRTVLKQANPVVGLLSIGTEDGKGNEVTKKAFPLMQKQNFKFRGNIEGHDLFMGETDVAVCDGFVGNVVLKTAESVAHALGFLMKKEFVMDPVRMFGALLLRGAPSECQASHGSGNLRGRALAGCPGRRDHFAWLVFVSRGLSCACCSSGCRCK